MQLDDRDIICETDYSPLSGEELVTQIEWHAAAMSGASAYDLERITGPARALLARAEAAEASREALADRLVFEMEQRDRLAARVVELEAQVAQGWRDFTEHPPIGEQIQITTVIDAVREEPDGLYRIGHTSEWQAWRPAPQEPTP